MVTRRVAIDLATRGMPVSTLYVGGAVVTFATRTSIAGVANVSIPLPVTGGDFYCQWMYDDPTVKTKTRQSVSPGLSVTIVK